MTLPTTSNNTSKTPHHCATTASFIHNTQTTGVWTDRQMTPREKAKLGSNKMLTNFIACAPAASQVRKAQEGVGLVCKSIASVRNIAAEVGRQRAHHLCLIEIQASLQRSHLLKHAIITNWGSAQGGRVNGHDHHGKIYSKLLTKNMARHICSQTDYAGTVSLASSTQSKA